jgi:hypothetical protein
MWLIKWMQVLKSMTAGPLRGFAVAKYPHFPGWTPGIKL